MLGNRRIVAALAGACLCLLVVFPQAAQATFPGRPGVIVFNLISLKSEPEPTGGLHAIRPDGTGLRQLTDNPRDYEPSFAPSGRRLVFRRFGTENRDGLYVLNMRTGSTRRLVPSRGGDQSAAFGRKGMVAFTRFVDHSYELFVRSRSGKMRRLTRTDATEEDPVFTPDGKRILFVRYHPTIVALSSLSGTNSTPRVYSIRTDGTGLRLLKAIPEADDLETSPNGRRIAFSGSGSRHKSGAIWTKRLSGGPRRLIAANAQYPAYSPAGGKIAYSNREGIWVRRADGRGQAGRVVEARYAPASGGDELAIQPAWQPLPRKSPRLFSAMRR